MGREGVESENPALNIRPKIASNDEILLDMIDESLYELFGTRPREALYDHLERNYGIAREELPKHLDEFSSVLRKNFGASGRTVERRIAKKFCAKMGKEFHDGADHLLSAYIEYGTKAATLTEIAISTTVTLTGPPNANDGWAVGNWSTLAPLEPAVYHCNGFAGTAIDLNSVFMTNAGDFFSKYFSHPAGKLGMCA